MPLHDWTRVPSGLFHHFHQSWSVELATSLNAGKLPKEMAALLERSSLSEPEDELSDNESYASRANRIPLESTYRATWDGSPEEFRVAVETGDLPDFE